MSSPHRWKPNTSTASRSRSSRSSASAARRGCAARRRRRRGRRAARRATRSGGSSRSRRGRAAGRGRAARWRPAGRRCRAAPGGRARRRGTVSRRGRRRPARRGRRGRDQPVGHRQLVRSASSSWRWCAERGAPPAGGGRAQRVGGDERVAVAVAADPGAGQQHRPRAAGRRRASARPAPARSSALIARDDVEKRQLVVAQRLVDLVLEPQPGQPQQRRLPEREHRAPQLDARCARPRRCGCGPVALRGSAR